MRARLLDLSARNPLLNYSHPRASSLRIVDEVPALVLESMVSNGGFRFAPLSSDSAPGPVGETYRTGSGRHPSADATLSRGEEDADAGDDPALQSQSDEERREAAKGARARREEQIRTLAEQLGLNPSYDLLAVRDSSAPQHVDRRLQTLLTPDELEARLQKMQAAAVTSIQESGANMLHLLFGFVEWTDVIGGKTRMAPLVLLPVTLYRVDLDVATHTFPYTVAASGEDWSTNVTLQEKCRKDFGFVLPAIEPEENLEEFFSRVESVLKSAPPGWTVRRQLTLGLVSFGKILMWRDLDPTKWPKHRALLDNPLLRQVLGADDTLSSDGENDADSAEMRTMEYNIDALPPDCGHVPPIVVPADSSQHSVLVDVQRGENLVVQGPPGTGKSQTITNIIADAIASRKKILFVAEKKAALEVVSRRLTEAGLGPFCLPLHSHTSNKREFLDGLKQRIDISGLGNSASDMLTVEGLLAEVRSDLTGHVERLHAPFGSLGDTAFSIFWRTRRLAGELPKDAIASLSGTSISNAVAITPGDAARHRATLMAFAAAYTATSADTRPGELHPWFGVSRADLSFDDASAVLNLAGAARAALLNAESTRKALQDSMDGAEWPDSSDALTPLLERSDSLASPEHSVAPSLIEAIHRRTGIASVRGALGAADLARRSWSKLWGPWGNPGAINEAAAGDYDERLREEALTFGGGRTVFDLGETVETLAKTLDQLAVAERLASAVATELGVSIHDSAGLAVRLIKVALASEQLTPSALELRSSGLMSANAYEQVAALAARASALVAVSEKLDARFAPDMRPSLGALREMAGALSDGPRFFPSLFSGSYRRAVAQYRRMGGGRAAARLTMTSEVDALARHVSAKNTFVNDPALTLLFGNAAQDVNTPFLDATALLSWTRDATLAFRGGGDSGRALADAVWSAPLSAWSEVGALALGDKAATAAANGLLVSLPIVAAMTGGEIARWESLPFSELRAGLARLHSIALNANDVALRTEASPELVLAELQELLSNLRLAWAADADLASHSGIFRELGMSVPSSVMTDGGDVLATVRGALTYLSQFDKSGLPTQAVEWLASGEQADRIASLRQSAEALRRALVAVNNAESKFAASGAVDLTQWYSPWPNGPSLRLRIERFDRAILAGGSLGRYVTQLRARAAVVAGPLPAASTLLESGDISANQLPVVYDYLLARTLAELVLRERPELDQFSGDVHETRRAQFVALDERFIALTQQIIAQRANAAPRIKGVGWGPVKDLSEQSLIEREIEKTRRNIPIREMFKRAGRAIQSLKPCIMMGPQAVAQYLPPGLFHFDLIVMDEASQMRPEDALGAIARGSQLVVVGDPKQLGPTSFFDVQTSDDDEIEETAANLAAEAAAQEAPRGASVLERSESILLAAARRYPLRMLRWHYRSKYPELIAFSNAEFYNNDLVLFPHPGIERQGDGVNFRSVENAVYSSSTNHKEAQDVVCAVRAHAAECPERTLLVVTMNQPQRELVDTLIQAAEKDDATLAAFRARHEGTLEPFGVKNLENVQGDERDVIYVSVTYGPNDRGTVAQGFGPINTVGGERRLNVLFTRAKYRLDVFCSFDPTVLRVTDTSPRGLCVLRDYLRFAKEKSLATGRFTAKEPDSDFEVEVARALRAHGYDVHPQIGVAGYFLDLAVVDPEHPGRYILAVECDGATYHSAKSARDRDRLRQGVLEKLGWNFHRIWSTDWFRDPRGETLKTVRQIEQLQLRAR